MKRKFLSVLLCLCMVLTMAPAAFAEEYIPNEDAGAATFEAALMAEGTQADPIIITSTTSTLEDGKYYKLNSDVTLTSQIKVGNGVTAYIDLESGTLTAGSGYTIQINKGGTLTVTGTNGTVAGGTYGALRNSGGTVTINGGTFTSTWRISVKNEESGDTAGTMTINNGTFICNKEPMDQAVQNFCNLTITGGTFGGKVVTWQDVGDGYADYGDTTITGGTFNEDVLVAVTKGGLGDDATKTPKLSISGADTVINADVGFFAGNADSEAPASVNGTLTISGATVHGDVYNGSKGAITIENATIDGDITNKANGEEGTAGDGSVTVTNSTITGDVDEDVTATNCVDADNDPIGAKYTVTVTPETASVDKSEAEKGEVVTVNPGAAASGLRYSIVVKDADGNTVAVSDNKFTMPASNVTVEVTSVQTYTVTKAEVPAGQGTVTCGIENAAEGDTVTFTVSPASGYQVRFAYYKTANGTNVQATKGDGNTYSFTMPAENVTICVMFWGEDAGCVYSGTGLFQGTLTFSGLGNETDYVVQVAKLVNGRASGAHAIMFFTSDESGAATVQVLGNPGGYEVQLYMYPDGATAVSDLVRVPVTVTAG